MSTQRLETLVDDALVFEGADGFMRCDCGDDDIWCQHIRKYFDEDGDADMIWLRKDRESFPAEDQPAAWDIQIALPITPSVNFWMNITLLATTIPQTYKLIIDEIDDRLEDGSLPSLGFVHPGEGRRVMREMVIDWFRGAVNVDRLECSSATHGWNQEMKWQAAIKNGWGNPEFFQQKWYVLVHGVCSQCDNRDFNFDGLVPGHEGETWSSRVGTSDAS